MPTFDFSKEEQTLLTKTKSPQAVNKAAEETGDESF